MRGAAARELGTRRTPEQLAAVTSGEEEHVTQPYLAIETLSMSRVSHLALYNSA